MAFHNILSMHSSLAACKHGISQARTGVKARCMQCNTAAHITIFCKHMPKGWRSGMPDFDMTSIPTTPVLCLQQTLCFKHIRSCCSVRPHLWQLRQSREAAAAMPTIVKLCFSFCAECTYCVVASKSNLVKHVSRYRLRKGCYIMPHNEKLTAWLSTRDRLSQKRARNSCCAS